MSEDSDNSPGWRFWIDRGGTFTDVIARAPDGTEHVQKLRSCAPSLYADAAVEAIRQILANSTVDTRYVQSIRIGTTVATNALLEASAPPVALLVTEGFSDLLQIADQRRRQLFGLQLVPREIPIAKILTTRARVQADGRELSSHNLEALEQAFTELAEDRIEHLAISLLHNWQHPSHEEIALDLARSVGIKHITCSHQTAPIRGYLARTETTLVDTWLTPVLHDYLSQFKNALGDIADVERIAFMQSHGGLASAATVRGKDAVLSGPAGGLIALAEGAKAVDLSAVIGMDMGGTSTDICHWRGTFEQQTDNEIGGYRLHTPMLRLDTIASGGGSLLSCADGRLQVGPGSAGASPGPAAYGMQGPATLTDANVVLGRLPPEFLPTVFGEHGDLPLQTSAAQAAIDALRLENAALLGDASLETLAEGWLRIAVEQVANAGRQLTLKHGSDPRQFALAAFGGAAGQIACAVADALNVSTIWLHPRAGVLSALGIGIAERKTLREISIEAPLHECWNRIEAERQVQARTLATDARLETTALIAIAGTDGSLEIPWGDIDSLRTLFKQHHQQRYGVEPEGELTLVGVRYCVAISTHDDVPIETWPSATALGESTLWLQGKPHRVPVLPPAAIGETPIAGPFIMVSDHTTLVVEPGWSATRNASNHLLLHRTGRAGVVAPKYKAVDPALLEVFNRRFTLVAEHMGHVLERTAQSVNIRERLDYSCALFDANANLIANAPHMPVHLGSMGSSVQHVLERVPSLKDGDVYLVNSPYAGGTHLPDITAVRPWFDQQGDVRFFVASRAHHADVGGLTPGSMPANSTTIDQEGVLLDCFQLVADGVIREAELRSLLSDAAYPARNPERNVSDLKAQLAALQEGCGQIDRLVKSFGEATVDRYMHLVFENARKTIADVIAKLPNGEASVVLDDQSQVTVALVVRDQRLTVDFTGTSAQHPGNFNAPSAVTRAAVLYFLRVLAARDIPLNDGCLADVEIIVPQRSMLDPASPAAVVAGNVETSQAVTNALFAASGRLAHGQGTMNNLTFGNERVQYYETIAGGSGAGAGFPGASGVQTHMTNSRTTDPEILETRLPVRLLQFELRRGSGGAGRWVGGDGIVRRLEMLEPVRATILSGNRRQTPSGIKGGDNGAAGINRIRRADGALETLPGVASAELDAGDVFEILTPGGGGFGKPGD
ncbi:MAG: hydantoinase B/oxoprolinase family protein [Pseudomonadota bacterium]